MICWTIQAMMLAAGFACVACGKGEAIDRTPPSSAMTGGTGLANGGNAPGAKAATSASSIPYPLIPVPKGGW